MIIGASRTFYRNLLGWLEKIVVMEDFTILQKSCLLWPTRDIEIRAEHLR